MKPVILVICVGLDCDPNGDCHGLRAPAEVLHAEGLCVPIYASYQEQNLAGYVPVLQGPVVMVGHSLGGGRVHKSARNLIVNGGHVESLILIEPVPVDGLEWINVLYRFEAVDGVPAQRCFHCDPWVWGRRYRDDWLNQGVSHSGGHSDICTSPIVLNYIDSEVRRLAA